MTDTTAGNKAENQSDPDQAARDKIALERVRLVAANAHWWDATDDEKAFARLLQSAQPQRDAAQRERDALVIALSKVNMQRDTLRDEFAEARKTSGALWTLISQISEPIRKCFRDRMMPFAEFQSIAVKWAESIPAENHPDLLRLKIAALQRFKDYVHKRLDDAGVPVDPDSPHKAEGCRIGGRLDCVFTELADLRRAMAVDMLKLLRDYRCQHHQYPDDGGGCALVDVLTPDGDADISRGQEELELLADHLAALPPAPSPREGE